MMWKERIVAVPLDPHVGGEVVIEEAGEPNTVHLSPFSPDTEEPQSYRWWTQYTSAMEGQAETRSVRTEEKKNTQQLQILEIRKKYD